MVPCPWFREIANSAAGDPALDLGVHLTLTSEWPQYRWGPLSTHSRASGLVDEHGYFPRNCVDLRARLNVEAAEIYEAFLRLMDPRDTATRERLDVLNQERAGVWRCHTQFNCTAVCPKSITLTDSISWLKRAMLFPGRFKKA